MLPSAQQTAPLINLTLRIIADLRYKLKVPRLGVTATLLESIVGHDRASGF